MTVEKPSASERSNRDGVFPSPRISGWIAYTEIVQKLRKSLRSDSLLMTILLLGGSAVVLGVSLYRIGHSVATAGGDWQSSMAPVLVVALLAISAYHFVNGVGLEPNNKSLLLTVRPSKDLAGGQLLMRFCETVPLVVIPAVLFFVGFSVASGTPRPVLGGILLGILLNAVGITIGFPAGLAARGIKMRSPTISRYWPLLVVPLAVGYVLFLYVGGIERVIELAVPVISHSPLGWITDVALLTTPGSGADPIRAGSILVFAVIVCFVGVRATVLAGRYTWLADGHASESSRDDVSSSGDEPMLERTMDRFCRRSATAGIAAVALRRAYRAPYQLLFGLVPLLGSLPILEQLVLTGSVPWYTPWAVAFYGAWLAGVTIPLNIIGVQGKTLPQLLTTRTSGRDIVNGYVLAAVVPIVLPTVPIAVGAGHLAGLSVTSLLVVGLTAILAHVASAVLAAAIGVAFPRLRSPFDTRTMPIPPSKTAYSAFSIVLFLLLGILSIAVPSILNADASVIRRAVGFIALLSVVGCVGGAYRYAIRSIDTYRLS